MVSGPSELTDLERAAHRRALRARRNSVPTELRAEAAGAVLGSVISICDERGARTVAVYAAIDGELDCEPAAERLRRIGCETWYPVVAEATVNQAGRREAGIEFRRWDGDDARSRGRFGILEPPIGPESSAVALDIVIVPLVSFDSDGNRLGFGAGYYDRALANDRSRPMTVGLAYDFQELPRWRPAAHDVALDLIITPTRVLRCPSG